MNGERRSFALLRDISDRAASQDVRDLILRAYAEAEVKEAEPAAAE